MRNEQHWTGLQRDDTDHRLVVKYHAEDGELTAATRILWLITSKLTEALVSRPHVANLLVFFYLTKPAKLSVLRGFIFIINIIIM